MLRRRWRRQSPNVQPRTGGSARRQIRGNVLPRATVIEVLEARCLLTVQMGSDFVPPSFVALGLGVPGQSAEPTVSQASVDIRVRLGINPSAGGTLSPPFSPSAVSQAYGFNNLYIPGSGGGFIKGTGAGQTIAIVIAYNQPNLVADLHNFDQVYGLSDPQITIVNQSGSTNPANLPGNPTSNWGLEASLDVEWVHALAPAANILVVEATNNSLSNLYAAATTAAKSGTGSLSSLPSATVVTMSWGGSEYANDSSNTYFNTPSGKSGVVFLASTGDTGTAAEYPAADPRVIAVGATALTINSDGSYASETGWSGSNGGFSTANALPTYQQGIQAYAAQNTSNARMLPDVSFNGSSTSTVRVYDSYDYPSSPWVGVYGTSVSAPSFAALVAIVDQGRVNEGLTPFTSPQALSALYAQYSNGNYSYAFHDASGGANASYSSGPGYDLVTGLGSPRANVLAAALTGVSETPSLVAPSGTISSLTPSFQWSAIGGATGYYLTVVDTTSQTTVLNAISVAGTSYVPTTLLVNGHSFQWRVQAYDSAGPLGPASSSSSFTVAAPNHAPTGSSRSITTLEDVPYVFAASDFGFSDPNDNPQNNFLAVEMTTVPLKGSLVDNGVAVTPGQFVPVTDIAAGLVKFIPAPNANGTPYISFAFQVEDDGGTANGGANLDPALKAMSINVTSVNDAPTGANNTVATLENAPYVFAAGNFGFSDSNDNPPNNFLAVKVTTLPAQGQLTDKGGAVVAGQFVTVADIAAGLFKFIPAANTSGAPYSTFTFQVEDDGGTNNGGVNLDPAPKTITVSVAWVNQPPAGANNTVATQKDTPYIFGASDFGFSDSNDSPPNNFLSVEITTLPAAGALTDNGSPVVAGQFVSVADINAGLLSFAPAAGATGAPYAAFTFQVQDNGGTANGGINLDPSPKAMTVDVFFPVAAVAGPATALRGESTVYTLTVVDSPSQEAAGFTFVINWGDGTAPQTVTGMSGMQVTHGFNTTGTLTVSVTASDQVGGTSAPATQGVHVDAVQLRPDAQNPALVDLVWGGDNGTDQVQFSQISGTMIRVQETMLNSAAVNNVQDFSGVTGRVIASGDDGNDVLDARGLLTTQATLDGGAGNNTIYGGSAGDILIGGSNGGEGKQGNNVVIAGNGDNTIYGNGLTAQKGASGGNNLIIGGTGHDTIYGNFGANPSGNGGEGGQNLIVGGGGGDTIYASQIVDGAEGGHGSILIAGTTNLNQAALQSILNEWTSKDALATKIADMNGTGGGSGLNGTNYLQSGVTVFDDGVADTLYSDSNGAANWLFLNESQDAFNRTKSADLETDIT
jgi:hypothetical protein